MPSYHGYRGEALASVRDMCLMLEVETRHQSSLETNVKVFHNGRSPCVSVAVSHRPSKGTTVTVCDLFHTMPVRKKSINMPLEMMKVRRCMEAIALIRPSVSFSLRDDMDCSKLLQTHKANSPIQVFGNLYGMGKARFLREAEQKDSGYHISGYFSVETHHNKHLQFVYLNRRLVLKSQIHKAVNHLLAKSLLFRKQQARSTPSLSPGQPPPGDRSPQKYSDRHAIYILCITCPQTLYDITFDPSKTLVEFQNWEHLLKCVESLVKQFLEKENLLPSWEEKPHFSISPELRSQKGEETNSQDDEEEEIMNEDADRSLRDYSENSIKAPHAESARKMSNYAEVISTDGMSDILVSAVARRKVSALAHRASDDSNANLAVPSAMSSTNATEKDLVSSETNLDSPAGISTKSTTDCIHLRHDLPACRDSEKDMFSAHMTSCDDHVMALRNTVSEHSDAAEMSKAASLNDQSMTSGNLACGVSGPGSIVVHSDLNEMLKTSSESLDKDSEVDATIRTTDEAESKHASEMQEGHAPASESIIIHSNLSEMLKTPSESSTKAVQAGATSRHPNAMPTGTDSSGSTSSCEIGPGNTVTSGMTSACASSTESIAICSNISEMLKSSRRQTAKGAPVCMPAEDGTSFTSSMAEFKARFKQLPGSTVKTPTFQSQVNPSLTNVMTPFERIRAKIAERNIYRTPPKHMQSSLAEVRCAQDQGEGLTHDVISEPVLQDFHSLRVKLNAVHGKECSNAKTDDTAISPMPGSTSSGIIDASSGPAQNILPSGAEHAELGRMDPYPSVDGRVPERDSTKHLCDAEPDAGTSSARTDKEQSVRWFWENPATSVEKISDIMTDQTARNVINQMRADVRKAPIITHPDETSSGRQIPDDRSASCQTVNPPVVMSESSGCTNISKKRASPQQQVYETLATKLARRANRMPSTTVTQDDVSQKSKTQSSGKTFMTTYSLIECGIGRHSSHSREHVQHEKEPHSSLPSVSGDTAQGSCVPAETVFALEQACFGSHEKNVIGKKSLSKSDKHSLSDMDQNPSLMPVPSDPSVALSESTLDQASHSSKEDSGKSLMDKGSSTSRHFHVDLTNVDPVTSADDLALMDPQSADWLLTGYRRIDPATTSGIKTSDVNQFKSLSNDPASDAADNKGMNARNKHSDKHDKELNAETGREGDGVTIQKRVTSLVPLRNDSCRNMSTTADDFNAPQPIDTGDLLASVTGPKASSSVPLGKKDQQQAVAMATTFPGSSVAIETSLHGCTPAVGSQGFLSVNSGFTQPFLDPESNSQAFDPDESNMENTTNHGTTTRDNREHMIATGDDPEQNTDPDTATGGNPEQTTSPYTAAGGNPELTTNLGTATGFNPEQTTDPGTATGSNPEGDEEGTKFQGSHILSGENHKVPNMSELMLTG